MSDRAAVDWLRRRSPGKSLALRAWLLVVIAQVPGLALKVLAGVALFFDLPEMLVALVDGYDAARERWNRAHDRLWAAEVAARSLDAGRRASARVLWCRLVVGYRLAVLVGRARLLDGICAAVDWLRRRRS